MSFHLTKYQVRSCPRSLRVGWVEWGARPVDEGGGAAGGVGGGGGGGGAPPRGVAAPRWGRQLPISPLPPLPPIPTINTFQGYILGATPTPERALAILGVLCLFWVLKTS